jgi:hypothetical protein
MTCTIDWNASFQGEATVKVYGVNDCGISNVAAQKMVNVINTTGISENLTGISISVFPNPNEGSFTLELTSQAAQHTNIRINNAFGHKVWEKLNVDVTKDFSININLAGNAEGVYFLNVETEKGVVSRKIMIHK